VAGGKPRGNGKDCYAGYVYWEAINPPILRLKVIYMQFHSDLACQSHGNTFPFMRCPWLSYWKLHVFTIEIFVK